MRRADRNDPAFRAWLALGELKSRELSIPGCELVPADPTLRSPLDKRDPGQPIYDPCEFQSAAASELDIDTYFGTQKLTPLEAAQDRGWTICWFSNHGPNDDCAACRNTGVVVYSQERNVPRHARANSHYYDCVGCNPQTQEDCALCLGSGWNFYKSDPYAQPTPKWTQERDNETLVLIADRILEQFDPQPPPEPEPEDLWVTRVVPLESKLRRPCGVCVEGYETNSRNGTEVCRACKGRGSHPVVRGNWLCNVNTQTGETVPKYLPITLSRNPYNGNLVWRRKPHDISPWRTSDGSILDRTYWEIHEGREVGPYGGDC